MYQYIVVKCVNLPLSLFRCKIFAIGKYFHFTVFGSVYENVV